MARTPRKAPVKGTTTRKPAPAAAIGPRILVLPHGEPVQAARKARAIDIHTSGHDAAGDWSLHDEATKWSSVVLHRSRWVGNARSEARLRSDAECVLARLLGHASADDPAARADFAALAAADMLEVQIPFESEGAHWEYRVFPWEFVLSQATRDFRVDEDWLVVRHLHVQGGTLGKAKGKLLRHIESVPAPLRKVYDFDSERMVLDAAATMEGLVHEKCYEVDASWFDDAGPNTLRTTHAAIVHVSGFDTHQGAQLMGWDTLADGTFSWRRDSEEPNRVLDGMLLRGARGNSGYLIDAQRFASRLFDHDHAPQLVSFNTYNSAARLAPLCVAEGAGAAIGFQDTFDDDLAELFFSALYRACASTDWHELPAAFRYAWSIVRAQGRALRGAGVVLWSRTSIADAPPRPVEAVRDDVTSVAVTGKRAGKGATKAAPKRAPRKPAVEADAAASALRGDEPFAVRIEPVAELNYSILHNDGALFDRFSIMKTKASIGRVDDVSIDVALHLGDERASYQTVVSIDEHAPMREFAQDIKVALTSTIGRAQREAVRSSLFVEVAVGRGDARRVLYRDTKRVSLLSVDEWRDDDVHRIWLPSFVLPRDPAVLRVIDSAQRYLMALRDSPGAGFDGYQSVASERDVPTVAECESIDRQVQAIWSALIYDYSIAYVNPPPSFTESSQRLRTPSDVLDGHRGTCIDLALLLASCLEYVDIHAGIVLLKAHAFPVYWRHSSYLDAFRVGLGGEGGGDRPRVAGGREQASWSVGSNDFRAIKRELDLGHLVPLETVMLTQHVGFADAITEGMANLRSRADFDSLLDITLARTDAIRPVTPLPVRREGER